MITIVAALVVVAGLYFYVTNKSVPSGKYDALAQCIKDSGATFYGAFWCPHCRNQKDLFGDSARLLPYVECSLPDASGQNQTCTSEGVTGYPTWVFKDGSRLSGEISLADLAKKTSCALPVN